MGLMVWASAEKQSCRRSCSSSIAECQRPKSVDEQQGIVGSLHETFKLVVEAVERSDPTASKVSHQDRVAEGAEISWRPYHSPRGIEPRAVCEVADVFPCRCEDFNVAQAIAGHIIVPDRVLFGVRDKQAASNVLYVEWRETLGNAVGATVVIAVVTVYGERVTRQSHRFEIGVVHFDSASTKIRNKQETLSVVVRYRHAFVYRAIRGTIVVIIDDQDRRWAAVPSRDRSIFSGKHEQGRFSIREHKITAAIEYRAGRSGDRACRSILRGWNRHDAVSVDGNDLTRSGVESGNPGVIVTNPPRRGGAAGED